MDSIFYFYFFFISRHHSPKYILHWSGKQLPWHFLLQGKSVLLCCAAKFKRSSYIILRGKGLGVALNQSRPGVTGARILQREVRGRRTGVLSTWCTRMSNTGASRTPECPLSQLNSTLNTHFFLMHLRR